MGLVLYAPAGACIWANAAAAAMLGVNIRQLRQRPYRPIASWFFPELGRAAETTLATGKTSSQELRLRPGSAPEICLDCQWSRVQVGGRRYLLLVLQKAANHRAAETEWQKARAEAESAIRTKTQFLANLSHEIRTPLHAILGYADFLATRLPDPKLGQAVQAIADGGGRLLKTFEELLDLTKLEAGLIRLEPQPLFLDHLCCEIVRHHKPEAILKGLSFEVVIDHSVPAAVLADEARLFQVLSHLVHNAIKFTETGGVQLELRADPGPAGGGRTTLNLTVADTGIGIPEDELKRILGAFEQRQGQDQGRYGGLGLGLALTKKLVDLMGGQLRISSQVHQGSRFEVYLPELPLSCRPPARSEDRNRSALAEPAPESTPAPSPAEVSPPRNRENLSALVKTLQEELMPVWRRLSLTLTINEVEEFACQLKALSQRHEQPDLSAWASQLQAAVEQFQPRQISELMAVFPIVVRSLESLTTLEQLA